MRSVIAFLLSTLFLASGLWGLALAIWGAWFVIRVVRRYDREPAYAATWQRRRKVIEAVLLEIGRDAHALADAVKKRLRTAGRSHGWWDELEQQFKGD